MKVAVILLNYNSSSDCRKCIDFLEKQRGVALDIIVVDNCSRVEERAAIELMCKERGLTFIPLSENRGYNAGNNAGLRVASSQKYKYAMIANPDMEFPDPNYVAKLVDVMEADSEIAAAGSDIITPEGVHQNPMGAESASPWSSWSWVKDILLPKKKSLSWIDHPERSHQAAKLSGAALMVRVADIADMGYFDENVFLYCEEAILAKQVERAAKKMFYTADVQAIHRHIKGEKGDPRPRFRTWRRSRKYYIDKYSDYSLFGRLIAKVSIVGYTSFLISVSNVRRKRS